MDDAKLVTDIYAQQILDIVKSHSEQDAKFLIVEFLKEYGAKAWKQGREMLAADVAKLV